MQVAAGHAMITCKWLQMQLIHTESPLPLNRSHPQESLKQLQVLTEKLISKEILPPTR